MSSIGSIEGPIEVQDEHRRRLMCIYTNVSFDIIEL